MATNLFCCVPNVNNGNFMLAFRVGPKQRPVTDQIDQPGNTLTFPVQSPNGPGRENIPTHAGHAESIAKVSRQLVLANGIQVITRGYPLVQLPQFRKGKYLLQLRLAKQDNLQQFFLGGFQIGQKPELFKYLRGQILGFVDHQHLVTARRVRLQQVLVDKVHQFLDRGTDGLGNLKLVADGGQQLPRREPGVENQRYIDIVRSVFNKAAGYRGLPGSYFTGNHNEAALALNTVHQVRQSFLVASTEIEVTGVWGDRKRRFAKAEKVVIHIRTYRNPRYQPT